MSEIEQLIEDVDQALTEKRYRPGGWQRLVAEVDKLPLAERVLLQERISSLGNKLHQRHGFLRMWFPLAFAIEICLAVGGLALLLGGGDFVLVMTGFAFLLLSLQPLIKTVVGLMVGVRYAYAYLWYLEPRFKMQYGTYLSLTPMQRIVFHSSGIIGTPLALLFAIQMLQAYEPAMFWGWLLFWVAIALQLVPFLAELTGLKKVGPFRLAVLTGAATIAAEIKKMSRGHAFED